MYYKEVVGIHAHHPTARLAVSVGHNGHMHVDTERFTRKDPDAKPEDCLSNSANCVPSTHISLLDASHTKTRELWRDGGGGVVSTDVDEDFSPSTPAECVT